MKNNVVLVVNAILTFVIVLKLVQRTVAIQYVKTAVGQFVNVLIPHFVKANLVCIQIVVARHFVK